MSNVGIRSTTVADRPAPASASVAEVVARLEAIGASLPSSDGVCCFSRLYLAVTEGVQAHLADAGFADPRFLARLDSFLRIRGCRSSDVCSADAAERPCRRPLTAYTSRCSVAHRASSCRVESWSLRSTFETWLSTVFTDRCRRAAISLYM